MTMTALRKVQGLSEEVSLEKNCPHMATGRDSNKCLDDCYQK